MKDYNIIIILGPTAYGNTKLAALLAHKLGSEIISADSRQVYRDMNIGTGKDYADYIVEAESLKYHLIDIADAGSDYHIHQYMQDFAKALQLISQKNKIPILCGGTGLYIDAVLSAYQFSSVPINAVLRDELKNKSKEELKNIFDELAATSYTSLADTSTKKRLIRAIEITSYLENNKHESMNMPALKPVLIGLLPDRNLRRKNIEERLQYRLQNGLLEETRSLLKIGVTEERLSLYGLEYKFTLMHLKNLHSYQDLQSQLCTAIQQFAKRQMTFFRGMERKGWNIHWIDASLPLDEQLNQTLKIVNRIPIAIGT